MIHPVELASAGIIALFVIVRVRREGFALAGRLAALALAAFIAEQSVISAYGFYGYTREAWLLMAGDVPVAVALTWAVVLESASDLLRVREGSAARAALLGGLLVLSDAAFIEPIAVRAGLWAWTHAGPFDVPLIGILGWALFAAAALGVLRAGWPPLPTLLGLLAGAPLVTHAGLLASWWSLLRWLPPPSDAAATLVVWLVALGLAVPLLRRADAASAAALSLRLPAALLFAALLAAHGTPLLGLYAAAFMAPYSALFIRGLRPARG